MPPDSQHHRGTRLCSVQSLAGLLRGRGRPARLRHCPCAGEALLLARACRLCGQGIEKVYCHRYASVLSAYGIGMADSVEEVQAPLGQPLDEGDAALCQTIEERFAALAAEVWERLPVVSVTWDAGRCQAAG